MFGNVKGWVMSAVIAALTAGLIYFAGRSPERSPPTGQFALALKPSAVPDLDFAAIVPKGTKDQDAAPLLQDLADKVKAKRIAFDKFLKTGAPSERRQQFPFIEAELKLLLLATQSDRMSGLAKPDELVAYGNKPYLYALKRAAMAANQYGLALTGKDPLDAKFKPDIAKARKYFEASFQLGRMLYEDRVIFKQWRDGLELAKDTAFYLGAFQVKPDADYKAKCAAFGEKVSAAFGPAVLVWTDLSHPIQANYPGDVFQVALTGADPLWRAEAILKLGRMRYMKGVSQADQRDAKLVVEQIAAQPNLPAAVRVAAEKAKRLDEDGFQDYDRE